MTRRFVSRCALFLAALALVACPKTTAPVDSGTATNGVVVTPTKDGTRVTIDGGFVYTLPSDLSAPLPWDDGVTTGTLPNGLRYYVEPNNVPDNRVELWLAVRIGSVHEDEDQQGLAHLLEHMAFNGTEHFPGNTLITYLESVGTRFGAHLNAHTSFEETIYKLQVPTDDEELLSKGFLVLSDWAGGLSLLDDAITDERGVVIEEWRRSRSAGRRAWDATAALRYQGAPHAVRQPIGTLQSLQSFTPDAVRRLYADWYRPDLMSVIVVGDIEPADAVRRIEQSFSGLTGPAEPRPRPPIAIPPHDDTLAAVIADPEERFGSVSLSHKYASVEGTTHAAYRDTQVQRLLHLVVNDRIRKATRDPNSPLIYGSISDRRMTPTTASQSVRGSAKGGQEIDGLNLLLTEVERVRRFGVLPTELERAKASVLDNMRSAWADRDNQESRRVLGELVRNFTNGENVPGLGYEYAMLAAWVPGITAEEVSAAGKAFLPQDSRVVVVTRPGGELPPLSEEDVLAAIAAAPQLAVEAPVDVVVPDALVAEPPEPGTVVATTRDDELGTVEWELSNGATVVLKTTDFKEDEVRFQGWTWGGHSRVSDADFVPAVTAVPVASSSGLADFDREQVEAYFAGKKASSFVWIGETTQGVSGSAAPKDLESALQKAFLQFVDPRFTEEGFELERTARLETARHRLNDPNTQFWDLYNEVFWQGHVRKQPQSEARVAAMDLARSEALYRDAFNNIGSGTFVFVGAVDEATLLPLVTRWIGSLPSGPERAFVDVGATFPDGAAANSIQVGVEPKGRHRLDIHGTFESTPDSRHQLRALASTLSILLREELRERLGGTYSAGARSWVTMFPTETYGITVDFQCDPERLQELRKAAWQILEQVRQAPVDAEFTQRVAEQERRKWETELKKNGYWLSGIAGVRQRGDDPAELARYRTLWEQITPEYVHAAAQQFLDLDHYVLVTQTPEEAAE